MAGGGLIGASPSELSAFHVGRVAAPGGEPAAAVFEVRCADCGGETFTTFLRTVTDDDGQTEVGIVLACGDCQHRRDLFDMRRHGYDGRFGHWKTLKGAEDEHPLPAAGDSPARVRVTYLYNIPADELQEHARETGLPVQDFYDGFQLAVGRHGAWRGVWDCECA